MIIDMSEERAKSSVVIDKNIKPKALHKILKHQVILTLIQYVVSIIIFIIGICLYIKGDLSNLIIGTIHINDIEIQNLKINIGAFLILISVYMFMKITLNLNISFYKGE
ncbi:MAG: hypothetical protein NC311_08815 [Muribaculaceae bacterium]|nr:hypothetical protein [Muribaculaceae bacterium]MCM1399934.1 hypothetical protein [Clostridium sp.]MCM1460736.1 hypothetical protein [Bacteroides sp.]